MSMKFYIDNTGKYLGAYSEGNPAKPSDALEVSAAPNDARQIYNNGWLEYTAPHKKAYREKRVNAGIVYKTKTIQTDLDSRLNISGAVQAALLNPLFTTEWRTSDNSKIQLENAEIIEMGLLVSQHVAKCFAAHSALNGTVYSTKEAVEAAFDNFYNNL